MFDLRHLDYGVRACHPVFGVACEEWLVRDALQVGVQRTLEGLHTRVSNVAHRLWQCVEKINSIDWETSISNFLESTAC